MLAVKPRGAKAKEEMANWKHRCDIKRWLRDGNLSFGEKKRRIAEALTGAADRFFEGEEKYELEEIAVLLADAEDVEEFDAALEDLYDWADAGHRLWLGA